MEMENEYDYQMRCCELERELEELKSEIENEKGCTEGLNLNAVQD